MLAPIWSLDEDLEILRIRLPTTPPAELCLDADQITEMIRNLSIISSAMLQKKKPRTSNGTRLC